jgi:hypothetical protein
MTDKNLMLFLCSLMSLAGLCAGCGGSSLGGDAGSDADRPDGSVDGSVDLPAERAEDWIPEPGTGTLAAEGEATFYESDVGEDFSAFGMSLLPIAFSGEVYTILVVEDASGSTDMVAAYRLALGGSELNTVWFGEVPPVLQPSICWTGEVFAASFPIREEGNRVLTITEAGELARTETVGTIDSGEPCEWWVGDAKHIMGPSSGPFILDFTQPGMEGALDALHLLKVDGSSEGTRVDVDLPVPSPSFSRPACAAVGHLGICFSGQPPMDKINMFLFDREGTVLESANFPATAHFEMGSAIADVGGAAAVFWADTPDWGDHINMGFALLGLDGRFIVSPTILDLAFERYDEMGLSAASSGTHVLVAGPPPDARGVVSGTYLYLFDLAGNLLDEPQRLEPTLEAEYTASVFWEGDAYAVLWNEDGGIMYRRYRVD